MAKCKTQLAGQWEFMAGETYEVYDERVSALMKIYQDESDALAEGEYLGALISFPIADGSAVYRVNSQLKGTVSLQHVPYGDAWQIPPAHMRGLTAKDIKKQIDSSRKMAVIFGGF